MLHAGHPIVFTNNIFGPTIIRTLEPSVPTITTHNHPDARTERPYNIIQFMNLKEHLQDRVFALLSETADELGLEAYIIGGYVRDILLQRPSKDIDVVVVGSGIEMAGAFARKLGKGAFLSVFKTYGTAQVKKKNIEVEFVGARSESYNRDSRNPIVTAGTLQDDQNRRDFTVNALALCLNKERFGELVDPFGGLADMDAKILRTPLDPDITFSDDPLRMMRAVRFASQLQFTIYPETFDAITRNCERIEIITKERIIDEFNKIMRSPKPSIGLMLLEQSGLLAKIFPELDRLKGVEKRGERAHKDVFLHTLKVLDSVAEKSDDLCFERAQSENWEEVRLSLDVDENNGSARTLDRTREP